MGYLDASVLAEVKTSTPSIYPVLKIAWPDQTRYYTTESSPLSSDTLGPVEPFVSEWGDIERVTSDYSGGLQATVVRVVVSDLSGVIQGLRRGRYQRVLEGSACSIFYALPSSIVSASAFPNRFAGIVENIERISTYKYAISMRSDDRALIGMFSWPKLSQFDFGASTFIDPESVSVVGSKNTGGFISVFLGRFDSNDATTPGTVGSIQAVRLNRSDGTGGFAYRYLAAFSWMTYVSRVVVDGVALANTAWIRTYSRFNGIACTEIWLASDPGVDSLVTFDGTGPGVSVPGSAVYLGSDVAASANPITNPVAQMRWVLNNGVFGTYRSGSFLGDGSRIDTASWDAAETFAENRKQRGVIPPVSDANERPIEMLTAWLRAWHYSAHWTPDGTLALATLEPYEEEPFWEEPRWIRFHAAGTEDAFIPNNPSKDRRIFALASSAWTVPTEGSRFISLVKDPLIQGPVADVSDNNFAEARGYLDPAMLPSSCTGYWAADYHANNTAEVFDGATVATVGDNYLSNFLTATGSPLIQVGHANGHASYKCLSAGSYFTGSAISAHMTADNFTLFVAFRVRAATLNSASWWLNHPIIACNDNAWGMFVKKNGAVYEVYGVGYDGSSKVTASIPINLDQWYVARFSHEGGYVALSLDNFTDEVTVSCGSFTVMTGTLAVGGKSATTVYTDMDIAALIFFNAALSGQGATAYSVRGLSQDHDIWLDLRDRYIP